MHPRACFRDPSLHFVPFWMTLGYSLANDLEGINQFQVDFEGHIVVVVVLALWANALQGAGILAVAPMDEADVLAVVELGVATGALDLDGFFKSESVAIFREYAGVAHRWVDDYLRLLHHELQRDVVDGLLVHTAISF